jgi:hypothetical protein
VGEASGSRHATTKATRRAMAVTRVITRTLGNSGSEFASPIRYPTDFAVWAHPGPQGRVAWGIVKEV